MNFNRCPSQRKKIKQLLLSALTVGTVLLLQGCGPVLTAEDCGTYQEPYQDAAVQILNYGTGYTEDVGSIEDAGGIGNAGSIEAGEG